MVVEDKCGTQMDFFERLYVDLADCLIDAPCDLLVSFTYRYLVPFHSNNK